MHKPINLLITLFFFIASSFPLFAQINAEITIKDGTPVKKTVTIEKIAIDNATLTLKFEKKEDQFDNPKAKAEFRHKRTSVDIRTDIFKKAEVTIENEYRRILSKISVIDDDKNDIFDISMIVADRKRILLQIDFIEEDFIPDDNDGDRGNRLSADFDCSQLDLSFLETTGCNEEKLNRDNFFGEDLDFFPKNKVVYVLDYEPDLNSHQFYKIYRSDNDEPRFNSETLVKTNSLSNGSNLLITVPAMGTERLKAKENIQFKIHNINRFRYNAAISSTHVRFDSQPSSIFTSYFIGDMEGILGDLDKQVKQTAIQAKSGKPESDKAEIKRLEENISTKTNCLHTNIRILNNYFSRVFMQCQRFPCCEDLIESGSLLQLGNLAASIHRDLNKLLREIQPKVDQLEKLEKNCKEKESLTKQLEALQKKEKGLKEEITKLEADPKKKNEETIKQKKEALKKLQDQIKQVKDKAAKIKCDQAVKDQIKKLIKEIEPSKRLLSLRNSIPSESDFSTLSLRLNSMNAFANQYVKTIPQLRGARLDLGFYIQEKDTIRGIDGSVTDTTLNSRLLKSIDSISLPIVNRWSVTFSSGPFVGFGDRITPTRYDYRPQPSGSSVVSGQPNSYEIVESGEAQAPLGFAAFINLQYQFDRWLGMGPSAGVGLSIESNPKPMYLGGVSLMFGQKRQLVLSGGALIGKVEEFDNTLLGGDVTYENTNLTIEYNDIVRSGWFFSIS